MTNYEIIKMARQAGFEIDDSCVISPQNLWYIYQAQLEAFAKLVAAKESKACLDICVKAWDDGGGVIETVEFMDEIEARGRL